MCNTNKGQEDCLVTEYVANTGVTCIIKQMREYNKFTINNTNNSNNIEYNMITVNNSNTISNKTVYVHWYTQAMQNMQMYGSRSIHTCIFYMIIIYIYIYTYTIINNYTRTPA